ncbi:MAG: 3-isopropylmalate dehydratase large subunit [Spirochaetaceae bacterium]|nr:MAG: 3-isopropylmalate dehydratase large subunit [Spirochaetaceae bacterium]
MGKNLLNKVWELHKVRTLPSGQDQLYIGLHLIHEVTSPQAFAMLAERKLKVLHPQRTFATVDHIVPTDTQSRPFKDDLAEQMIRALELNTEEHGITFFGLDSGLQGIVHIIGPELGLSQPGMTIACGDSHTSTHGALGAIAFGIGTSQVRDVLATQTLAFNPLKVRRIEVGGRLGPGLYSKDIILRIIAELGVKGGLGYAYEYGGPAVEALPMEARLTICNMSIEGGARVGYINPDQVTFDYLEGRRFTPKSQAFKKAVAYWKQIASDADAEYDDRFELDAGALEPMVAWGINPGQAVGVDQKLPALNDLKEEDREAAEMAYNHTRFQPGQPIKGQKIDVAFIGSCTNGRISDLREAARLVRGHKAASHVKALVVPGSEAVAEQAAVEGLPEIFREAGFQWRGAGCSMCLGMNPDVLLGDQICASSSNRNFIGRQGSPTGRTLLMSPAMAAAAAVAGEVADIRQFSQGGGA